MAKKKVAKKKAAKKTKVKSEAHPDSNYTKSQLQNKKLMAEMQARQSGVK